jgi:hypothetical protein
VHAAKSIAKVAIRMEFLSSELECQVGGQTLEFLAGSRQICGGASNDCQQTLVGQARGR